MGKKSMAQEAWAYSQEILEKNKEELFPYSQLLLSNFYHKLRLRVMKNLATTVPGDVIVDIGCADGYFLYSIWKPGVLKIGIDFAKNLLRKAKETSKVLSSNSASEFLIGDVENVGLRERSANIVICAELLEHVPNPSGVLRECSRILKNDGCLILSIPTVHFLKMTLSKLFGVKISYRSPKHLREYSILPCEGTETLAELNDEMTEANFRVVEIRNLGLFYLVVENLARVRLLTRFLETFELAWSSRTPLLFTGGLTIIRAVKVV